MWLERSGQQLGRSHHHRRNSSSLAGKAGKSGVKRNVEVTSTTSSPNSPFLMAIEESKKTMIAVQASLNGNIFMHCPVDIAEDFQVSFWFESETLHRLPYSTQRNLRPIVGLDWLSIFFAILSADWSARFRTVYSLLWNWTSSCLKGAVDAGLRAVLWCWRETGEFDRALYM